MTLSTFLISSVIIGLILLIIRTFWLQMLVIYYVLQLMWWSLVAALVWIIFVSQTLEGWYYVWAIIFLSFCGIIAVFAGIFKEVYGIMYTFLKKLLK